MEIRCPRCIQELAGCSPSGQGIAACDACGLWWESYEELAADYSGGDFRSRPFEERVAMVVELLGPPSFRWDGHNSCARWDDPQAGGAFYLQRGRGPRAPRGLTFRKAR